MVSMSEKCVATIPSRHWAQSALLALVVATIGAACAGGGMGGGGSTSSGITYSGPNRWTMTGPQGGPFTNPSMDFVLDNAASDPMSWSATAVPSFVQLDRQSGVIAGNAQSTVQGDLILAVAQTLLPGTYTEQLTFHNDSR